MSRRTLNIEWNLEAATAVSSLSLLNAKRNARPCLDQRHGSFLPFNNKQRVNTSLSSESQEGVDQSDVLPDAAFWLTNFSGVVCGIMREDSGALVEEACK